MLAALEDAEAHVRSGCGVAYSLGRAAETHAVPRGELAERWLEKRIECDRARAAAASMQQSDDAP